MGYIFQGEEEERMKRIVGTRTDELRQQLLYESSSDSPDYEKIDLILDKIRTEKKKTEANNTIPQYAGLIVMIMMITLTIGYVSLFDNPITGMAVVNLVKTDMITIRAEVIGEENISVVLPDAKVITLYAESDGKANLTARLQGNEIEHVIYQGEVSKENPVLDRCTEPCNVDLEAGTYNLVAEVQGSSVQIKALKVIRPELQEFTVSPKKILIDTGVAKRQATIIVSNPRGKTFNVSIYVAGEHKQNIKPETRILKFESYEKEKLLKLDIETPEGFQSGKLGEIRLEFQAENILQNELPFELVELIGEGTSVEQSVRDSGLDNQKTTVNDIRATPEMTIIPLIIIIGVLLVLFIIILSEIIRKRKS